VEFKREACTVALVQELMPLLELHYSEVAHYKDIPLDPDVRGYVGLENMGILRVYVARSDEGIVLGYAVYMVSPNLHYQMSVQAKQDLLFIHPEHRGFGLGFIGWCDEQLKAEGVDVVYQHVKLALDFGKMLGRLGYEAVETIYGRRL
jgi:GNAT superfamily N-acetyltransferase